MTTDQHVDDGPGHESPIGDHATDELGTDLGHDDHGHDEEPLGPIDVAAWGAGALGLLAGLAVALACYAATSPIAG